MKIKKFLSSLMIVFLLTPLIATQAKVQGENINVEAKSAILMEAGSGKIVFEKKSS